MIPAFHSPPHPPALGVPTLTTPAPNQRKPRPEFHPPRAPPPAHPKPSQEKHRGRVRHLVDAKGSGICQGLTGGLRPRVGWGQEAGWPRTQRKETLRKVEGPKHFQGTFMNPTRACPCPTIREHVGSTDTHPLCPSSDSWEKFLNIPKSHFKSIWVWYLLYPKKMGKRKFR